MWLLGRAGLARLRGRGWRGNGTAVAAAGSRLPAGCARLLRAAEACTTGYAVGGL